MFKLCLTLIAIAIYASALPGCAQGGDITVDTKATPKDIHEWLGSGDPRLVAWGAYFAREKADTSAVAPMLQLAEGWMTPDDAQNTLVRFRIDAMSEVLDALIQRKLRVPPAVLNAIASSFPRQAMILASRLPLDEAKPILMSWYERRNSKDNPVIARIAAMMLGKAPPPGFAASVLAESEESLEVTVESQSGTGFSYGYEATGACGDSMGFSPPERWPPFFDYGIEETTRFDHDPVIVEVGDDRITFHRIALSKGSGSCAFPGPLNAETRHRLLAEMLGVIEKKMPWDVRQDASIFWESREQFTSELKSRVASEEAKLHLTVEALYAKGFLTRAEADSVRPKLSITVFNDRRPVEAPLPQLSFDDPRTSVTYKKR
jgi:hypothetical protein